MPARVAVSGMDDLRLRIPQLDEVADEARVSPDVDELPQARSTRSTSAKIRAMSSTSVCPNVADTGRKHPSAKGSWEGIGSDERR